MSCPLLSDQLLLTCLSQNLVELHLTLYSDDQSQLNFDLDRLSGMSKLQQMHINSMSQTRTWTTQGLLSSLTALEGFTFSGDSMMVGPLMTALGFTSQIDCLDNFTHPRGSHRAIQHTFHSSQETCDEVQ